MGLRWMGTRRRGWVPPLAVKLPDRGTRGMGSGYFSWNWGAIRQNEVLMPVQPAGDALAELAGLA